MSKYTNIPFLTILAGTGLVIVSYILGSKNSEKKKKIFEIQEITKNEIKESLQKEVNERFSLYDTRLNALEAKVCGMASHEKRISSLGVRVSEMQGHGERIFQLEHEGKCKKELLESMEERIDNIGDLSCKMDILSQKVDNLEIDKPVYTFFSGENKEL